MWHNWFTWWRCEKFLHYCPFILGIKRWPVDSLHKKPVIWNFNYSFVVSLNKLFNNSNLSGDFCDNVTLMWRYSNAKHRTIVNSLKTLREFQHTTITSWKRFRITGPSYRESINDWWIPFAYCFVSLNKFFKDSPVFCYLGRPSQKWMIANL